MPRHNNREYQFPIGSQWQDPFNGQKVVIIGHDFVTDNALIYNYVTKQEQWITSVVMDDVIIKPWAEVVAYEKGLFDGLSEQYSGQALQNITKGRTVSEGMPNSFFIEERKNNQGEGEVWRFEYQEYVHQLGIDRGWKASLHHAMMIMAGAISKPFDDTGADRIVFRTYPQFDLQHHPITGERKIILYTRLVAFQGDTQVAEHKRQTAEAA